MMRTRPLSALTARHLLPFGLLCCAAAVAQTATPNPAPRPKQPATPAKAPALPQGSINGSAFCADTHKPARAAMIILQRKPGGHDEVSIGSASMARVGMDGRYSIEHVPPGEYAVIGVLPGYVSVFDEVTFSVNDRASGEDEMWKKASLHGTITVHGSEAAHLDLELVRGASVSGRVLYSDGAPASQVFIDLEDAEAKPASTKPGEMQLPVGMLMRKMFTQQTQSTDDEGRFRLSGLRPGKYRVVAVHPPSGSLDMYGGGAAVMGMMGMGLDPAAARIYAGDTMRRKAAKIYDLRAGQDTPNIDIIIPIEAFHVVKGRVLASDGRTVNLGHLVLRDSTDDTYTFAIDIAKDGAFTFPVVTNGNYMLTATGLRFGVVPENADSPEAASYMPLVPRAAFADTTKSVIVTDNDVADVNVVTTEVPLPPPAPEESEGPR